MQRKFDAIFCRNVVIYFDRDTQSTLWSKFAGSLNCDGLLFLGHSERIDTARFPQFRPAGTTLYQLDRAKNSDARRTSEWR
jgi:chemotaxis protein methyltransferase CheR